MDFQYLAVNNSIISSRHTSRRTSIDWNSSHLHDCPGTTYISFILLPQVPDDTLGNLGHASLTSIYTPHCHRQPQKLPCFPIMMSDIRPASVRDRSLFMTGGGGKHFTATIFAAHSARGQKISRPTRRRTIIFQRSLLKSTMDQFS